ncbi:nuclear receptor-binding -like, partial [Paramuricea clavata]
VVKKWCRQILSALSYLHACNPPIVHGNLSCDTIFIQHNGLIKIGSVAPDTIRDHVKTYHEERRNMHYLAPEYGLPGTSRQYDTAADVFAFGICTLEMTALELQDKESHIGCEAVKKAIETLDDDDFKDFIGKCLIEDPVLRPNVVELMFHKWLFEVPSLKLLSAYGAIDNSVTLPESNEVKDIQRVLKEVINPWSVSPDSVQTIKEENVIYEYVGQKKYNSGNLLGVLVLSILFGIILNGLGKKGKPIADWLTCLFNIYPHENSRDDCM